MAGKRPYEVTQCGSSTGRLRLIYVPATCLLLEGSALAVKTTSMRNTAPGGWSAVAVDDAKVNIAAQRAVASQASSQGSELKLLSIEDAQRQVVAGINYKLRLSVMKDQQRVATATVWGKPDGTYELTAWTWE